MTIGVRKNTIAYEHQSNSLTNVTIRINGVDYLAKIDLRPSVQTIYNVTISDDNWNAIATGLTNVLSWRLSERAGQDFYVAFVSAPTTYITAFGWLADQTEITAVYVKRISAVTLNLELLANTP